MWNIFLKINLKHLNILSVDKLSAFLNFRSEQDNLRQNSLESITFLQIGTARDKVDRSV